MNRRTLLQATAAVPFAAALASRQGSAQSTSESLSFDATAFTVETKTVTTAAGDIEVTYNSWPATLYVANPVDATYQSLTVKQPTALNGVAIDSSSAPILLDIPVGGYMSAAVDGGSTAGMTTGTMQMNGTPAAGQMVEMPSGTPDASGGPQMGGDQGAMTGALGSQGSGNAELALAAGFVVVRPGVRGRDNQADDGTWFGKAAAAIVDLKSAVRYIRANNGSLPGNAEMIISTGTSAGGALSTLLGASGDSDLYEDYLAESGAADASDAIFAVAAYCPITDLDHADGAYEWMFGAAPTGGAEVDPDVSAALAAQFEEYLPSLALTGSDGTVLDTTNYADHLLTTFLRPAASTWLAAQDDATRTAYLAENAWMEWDGTNATFSLEDFVGHIARK